MFMRIRKIKIGCLLLCLCLALSGCRTRTTGGASKKQAAENAAPVHSSLPGTLPEDGADQADAADETPGERTRENPEAARKEYDENAPAEIVPGTERALHGPGEGGGASASGENAGRTVSKLSDTAKETATQTVAADQAEQLGVAEDAKQADSAFTYFTVLLRDRMGGLFECQRQNVYWETSEDHVTIFKASLEHSLILNAGAYDVSARLLKENLHVDDGWIGRKNPGVIVKAVDSSVLGSGVTAAGRAEKLCRELVSREGWAAIDAVRNGRVLLISEELLSAPHLQTAAMLAIAKAASPSLMADVDIAQALEMLSEEATGSFSAGIYVYGGGL